MPSRPLLPPTQPPITTHNHLHNHYHNHHLLFLLILPLVITISILLLLFLLLYLYFTILHHSTPKTLPFSTSPPPTNPTPTKFPLLHHFSYRQLSRATNNFHSSTSLGRGAYAGVFLANVKTKQLAVKVLNPSNSDDTFHNELRLFSSVIPPSPFVVSLVGYSVKKKKKKKKKESSEIGNKSEALVRNILVYEYMKNGSLQEALFGSPESEPPVLKWEQRFQIILDVAQGISFLHTGCEPPVIHGDIKPSNVLLGPDFDAKISDFGLSRLKFDGDGKDEVAVDDGIHQNRNSPPVDFAVGLRGSSSTAVMKKKNCSKGKDMASMTANCEDELFSVDHSKELTGNITGVGSSPAGDELNPTNTDWWWRQDESGELWSRDYVSEWIGSQISPITDPDWDGENPNGDDDGGCADTKSTSPAKFKKNSHRSSTPIQLAGNREQQQEVIAVEEEEEEGDDGKKHKKMRDWWKEEYFAEIIAADKKKKKKKNQLQILRRRRIRTTNDGDEDEEETSDFSFKRRWSEKKKRSRSCSGASDIFSGDLFSRELSSTTSMRGTICYVAPESYSRGHFMEKTDIYSFGVLILVIVSGRRPLHVLSSPMKLERANLITWCRQLAHSGDVLDLVDERLRGEFDREKAALCINLGLLCLQRLPELRPESSEIVKILKGETDLPGIPVEFSPSPPSKRVAGKSRRKPKSELDLNSILGSSNSPKQARIND